MDAALRTLVRRRADDRCEYCGLRQANASLTYHIEYIIARQHGGGDDESNLCLACPECNLHKGPNFAGRDPDTLLPTTLFHPRGQRWDEHFELTGGRIIGRTAIGRTTVALLQMNTPRRVRQRRAIAGLR